MLPLLIINYNLMLFSFFKIAGIWLTANLLLMLLLKSSAALDRKNYLLPHPTEKWRRYLLTVAGLYLIFQYLSIITVLALGCFALISHLANLIA